jgi:hypothetical protein
VDLFLLRLTGSAFSWAQALPETENDTLEHIGAAFEARYMPKDIMKFRFAKEIYDNKQGETQSVDDYILKLRKQGGLAGLNETAKVFAALNGLRPHLTEYVIDHGYATLDELIKNARTAELKRNVCPPIERDSDAVVSCKLGAMESKLDNFMSEMRKSRTLANMSDDVERGREGKRVSFARPESRPTSPGVQTRSPSAERSQFQPSRFQTNRQFRPEGQQGGGFSQGRGGVVFEASPHDPRHNRHRLHISRINRIHDQDQGNHTTTGSSPEKHNGRVQDSKMGPDKLKTRHVFAVEGSQGTPIHFIVL